MNQHTTPVAVTLSDARPLSRNLTLTDNGYLVAKKVTLARSGIMTYAVDELPSALRPAFAGRTVVNVYTSDAEIDKVDPDAIDALPVSDLHTHTDLTVTQNAHRQAGLASNAKVGGGRIRATLTVTDAAAIQSVQSRKKRDVSLGYGCMLAIAPGVYRGQAYDLVRSNIKPNHVALVPEGRCGAECTIHDSGIGNGCGCSSCRQSHNHKGTVMSDQHTAPANTSIAVGDKVASVALDSVGVIEGLKADTVAAIKRAETAEGKVTTLETELRDAKAATDGDAFAKRVREAVAKRVAIQTKAVGYLTDAKPAELDAMSDEDMQRKALAVAKVELAEDASPEHVEGAFMALPVAKTDDKQDKGKGSPTHTFSKDNASGKDDDEANMSPRERFLKKQRDDQAKRRAGGV